MRNRSRRDSPIMVLRGLEDIVAGHLIAIARDESAHVAQVTVTSLNGAAGGPELEAIRVAARLLAQRAGRFLGRDWAVREWEG